jgi:hypothetical protein
MGGPCTAHIQDICPGVFPGCVAYRMTDICSIRNTKTGVQSGEWAFSPELPVVNDQVSSAAAMTITERKIATSPGDIVHISPSDDLRVRRVHGLNAQSPPRLRGFQ